MAKTKHELEEMTKDELVAYADDNDFEVHSNWLKDDIVTAIMKGEKAAAKAQPATVTATTAATTTATSDEQYPKVDPELAANQELAQQLPDEATRFAAEPPAEAEEK